MNIAKNLYKYVVPKNSIKDFKDTASFRLKIDCNALSKLTRKSSVIKSNTLSAMKTQNYTKMSICTSEHLN